jgi:WD40 repeat protein
MFIYESRKVLFIWNSMLIYRLSFIVGCPGLVACGTEKHGIRLCDLRTGDAVHAIAVPVTGSERSGGSCVKALDWSPSGDGHILAAGNFGPPRIYFSK